MALVAPALTDEKVTETEAAAAMMDFNAFIWER